MFSPNTNSMTRTNRNAWLAVVILTASVTSGCTSHSGVEGDFDRQFTVGGPLTLELTTGSGDAHITTGPPGEIRVHGEVHVNEWSSGSGRSLLQQIQSNPPISQEGTLIRIGGVGKFNQKNVSVDYTIVVPPDAQLRSTSSSGDLEVSGIQGPANFTCGSGDVTASEIGSDVQVSCGSGDVKLSKIKGQARVSTGSGDITLDTIQGTTRLQTGSGTLEISNPGDALEANTGSGDIAIKGASADIRLRTSSGEIDVEGNPGSSNYWDFHTNSGEVTLHVPSAASFRLYARSSSGDIDAAIPIVMEGTTNKHELRARIGDGKARVEIQTSSGDISLH
jgi:putative adhesin